MIQIMFLQVAAQLKKRDGLVHARSEVTQNGFLTDAYGWAISVAIMMGWAWKCLEGVTHPRSLVAEDDLGKEERASTTASTIQDENSSVIYIYT